MRLRNVRLASQAKTLPVPKKPAILAKMPANTRDIATMKVIVVDREGIKGVELRGVEVYMEMMIRPCRGRLRRRGESHS